MHSFTPTRPCWVEIKTHALEGNFRFLREVAPAGAELLAIVKADAYGHSIALCVPALSRAGATWFGVTTVEEGIAVRKLSPDAEIVIMGGIFAGQGPAIVAYRLIPVVWEPWQLDELESAARAAGGSIDVHLEVDTGMTRQGVTLDALDSLLGRFTSGFPVRPQAVMTHLFASDETNGTATAQQLAQLESAMQIVRSSRIRPQLLSVGASAALLGPEVDAIVQLAARCDLKPMLRPGLSLYGLVPRYHPAIGSTAPSLSSAFRRLQPVLTWKTRIETVHDIAPGTHIGYNGTFTATAPMRVALLPVGYADGLDRRLGNHFSLLVNGYRAPLLGRISMDQSVADVTAIPGVAPGDEVLILGNQGLEHISAFDLADACGTIPWEIFTRIGARVPRIAI